MRAIEWSQSALGAVQHWPQSVRTCVRILLTSRQPMFVWWGDQLINLYNDAYRSILGGKLFDDSYRGFLAFVAGQISASIANAQAYEEERKRAVDSAASKIA